MAATSEFRAPSQTGFNVARSFASSDEILSPRRFIGGKVSSDDVGNSSDDLPQSHTTNTFAEAKGKTNASNITRCSSRETRASIIEAGLTSGFKTGRRASIAALKFARLRGGGFPRRFPAA